MTVQVNAINQRTYWYLSFHFQAQLQLDSLEFPLGSAQSLHSIGVHCTTSSTRERVEGRTLERPGSNSTHCLGELHTGLQMNTLAWLQHLETG